jgi:chromosome segregation ATPase
VKKDNFNLQLENHFLKERLANMAPDHIEAALKENVKLKLEILNLSKEMKKLKKLLLQQDRDLAEAARNGDGKGGKAASDARELERLYREEKERRKAAESEYKRLEEELASGASAGAAGEDVAQLRDRLEDTEASEQVWRNMCETLEEELENAKAANEDHAEEMERVRDAADRAEDELEKLQAQHADVSRGLGDSIGVSKGREARLQQKVADLEQVRDLAMFMWTFTDAV